MVPVYNALLCISIMLVFSFFVTEVESEAFIIYSGDEDKAVWDLLPLMPCLWMLIEYPFNMIPFDWPMLIFVELLFTVYMLIVFLVQAFGEDHRYIYEAFDFYYEPGNAILWLFVCYVFLASVFAIFWYITMKVKLPKYE